VSLVARHLEEAGIATVIIGSAQDIVETVGVPRFVFVDFPLGNPLGRPDNPAEQLNTLSAALELVTTAVAPRMTRRMDLDWGSDDWRSVFMYVGDDNRAELAALGDARRSKQAARRG